MVATTTVIERRPSTIAVGQQETQATTWDRSLTSIGVLVAAHMALGLLVRASETAATLQALAVIALCAGTALFGRSVERLVLVTAYAVGSEVLWRMAGARVFWESGKLVVLFALGVGGLRLLRDRRGTRFALLFVACLVPGAVATVLALGPLGARQALSFNLAGPVALAVAVVFFSNVRAALPSVQRVLWALALPAVAIATVAGVGILAAGEQLQFTTESNFEASGGYGPNQVSTALGLGSLSFLLLAAVEHRLRLRAAQLLLASWMFVQALLTFSRGGVLSLVLAAAGAALAGAASPRQAVRTLVGGSAVVLVALSVVVPRVDDFTDGALSQRYDERSSTNRSVIAELELTDFLDSPVTGVGAGLGRAAAGDQRVAAHTEYTRLVAEHGIFGIAAIVLLGSLAIRTLRRSVTAGPVMVVALVLWPLVTMMHAGTRLAAVPFVFGWAQLTVVRGGSDAYGKGSLTS